MPGWERNRNRAANGEPKASQKLRWSSVKGTLAAYAEGSKPRFERVRHGYYQIKA